MIIIVDKNELMGRHGEFARQLPIEDIDTFDVVDNAKVTRRSVETANVVIVTDYPTRQLNVLKHRFDEKLHGRILPLSFLEIIVQDALRKGEFNIDYEGDDE
jgi:hypothetical protein